MVLIKLYQLIYQQNFPKSNKTRKFDKVCWVIEHILFRSIIKIPNLKYYLVQNRFIRIECVFSIL